MEKEFDVQGYNVRKQEDGDKEEWEVCGLQWGSPRLLGPFRKHVLSMSVLCPDQQVKLKQITPRTEEEKTEHSVAAERRRMRLLYADTIKDLLANCAIQDGEHQGP